MNAARAEGDAQPPQHQRVARRYKVFEATRMLVGTGETRVHLINLSLTGALVHAATPPDAGTPVTILLHDLSIPARIVWVVGERFGIAFAKALDENMLATILPS